MEKNSISVIILSLNEAGNIKSVVNSVFESLQKSGLSDYELILVDGGSNDGTGKIIDELSLKNENIRAIHNPPKKGLGHDFKTGISLASKNYVGWLPGDNEVHPETINNIFKEIGKTDVIIPVYTTKPLGRSRYRRTLSAIYVVLFNTIFGLHLRYFNGPCFFRRQALKEIVMSTDGPAYMAEILVQLIKKGVSYVEVPMYFKARDYGKTSVLKWKNVYLIAETIIRLFFRLHFHHNKRNKGEISAG